MTRPSFPPAAAGSDLGQFRREEARQARDREIRALLEAAPAKLKGDFQ